jgi:medium-chain acyl-[acyl-carrier-protein] hydrolase
MSGFSLRRARGTVEAPPLICFPASGGLGASYLAWASELTSVGAVVGVDLPGRGTQHRLQPAPNMARLIPWLAEQVAPICDGAIFYGHSFGALCAYEAARTLWTRHDRGPRLVIAGACAGPMVARARLTGMSELDLVELIGRLGGTDHELLESEEIRALFLPPIRRDFALMATYTPLIGRVVDFEILSIVGAADPLVTPQEALLWSDVAGGGFEMRILSGGHFFFRDAPEAFFDLLNRAPQGIR